MKGKAALVTGSSRGLGAAIAVALAEAGANVAVNGSSQPPTAAQKLVAKTGADCIALVGDVGDAAACARLVEETVSHFGGIDILVNNAARQQSHDSIEQIPSDQFDWTLKTNLYAMFWITREVVASMPSGGAIVCTASVNAYDPGENLLDYSMTKAAIVAFTKSLAKQMSRKGIRVNAVAPGPFWTPLQVTGGQTQRKLRDFGADTVFGRPGQPAELAPIYVLLASAEASYVTGQVFGASGGRGLP